MTESKDGETGESFDADWTHDTVRTQHGSDKLNERLDQRRGKPFKTKNNQDLRGNSKHRTHGIRCWGCGVIGHKIARCWWNTPKKGYGVQDFMHRKYTDSGGSRQHLNCQLAAGQVGRAKQVKILISLFGVCSQVM